MPGISRGAVTKDMKDALWAPANAQRTGKAVYWYSKKLRSWHGMLGYCQKDKVEKQNDKVEKQKQVIKSGDITDDALSVRCGVFATMAMVT